MKKILVIILSFVMIFSCSDDEYERLNQDPNTPTTASSSALFTAATVSLFDQMNSSSVNENIFRLISQYWTETTYIDEANYDINNRDINGFHFTEMYRDVLFDLQDAKSKLASEVSGGQLDNRQAMIEVLEVYTWQQLVDTFGNVPYSEALKAKEIPLPKYDDAETIYKDLFVRINTAISKFNTSAAGFGSSDLMYHDDINKWKKFANAVKLRLAMRVADVPSLATTSKMAAEQAYASGVFTSNADNAIITYSSTVPNTNPIYEDLVISGRNDFVSTNTMVDYLTTLNDPRIYQYYDENLGANTFVGGPYGDNNSFPNYTHIGDKLHNPTFRGVLLDYSEVSFLLAHAASIGYTVGGTTATHYTNGISASMDDWGVSSTDKATYLAQTSVAYATATGTWRQKIGKQFWIAMYNRGFEGWCVWRQFDYPVLNLPVDSGNDVPVRFTYPIVEQTVNGANYDAAAIAVGGDDLGTKLFWDKF